MNQPEYVTEKEIKAIEMKYLGIPYLEIAQAVGVEYSTVKSWFMSSGRLYSTYIEYAVEANRDRKNTALQLFTISLDKAVRTLANLLDSKDERIRLAAAREIINQHDMNEEPINLEKYREIRTADLMNMVSRLHSNQ